MKTRYSAMNLLSAAALAVCFGGLGATAVAAENPQSVTIEASKHGRVTVREGGGVAQASQQVSYSDLDLGTTKGADELANRIQRAATNVCGRLGALYPAGSFAAQWEADNLCVNGAVNGAMKQAKVAIASAERQGTER